MKSLNSQGVFIGSSHNPGGIPTRVVRDVHIFKGEDLDIQVCLMKQKPGVHAHPPGLYSRDVVAANGKFRRNCIDHSSHRGRPVPQQFYTGVFLDDWGGSWWWTIGVETVLVVPSVISPTTIVDNCGIVDHLSTIRGGQDKYSFGQLSYIHHTARQVPDDTCYNVTIGHPLNYLIASIRSPTDDVGYAFRKFRRLAHADRGAIDEVIAALRCSVIRLKWTSRDSTT